MLVMMLRTVALAAAWPWCSARTISAADIDLSASTCSSQSYAGRTCGRRSRRRCSSCTMNAGVSVAPAAVFVGCTVTASWVAAPAVTVTTAVCVAVTPAIEAVTVFDPATVEDKLPVATPFASVAAGCVRVFPVPVAVSTTVAPLTGLPAASRAVTVVVAVPLPAVITGGAASTVD